VALNLATAAYLAAHYNAADSRIAQHIELLWGDIKNHAPAALPHEAAAAEALLRLFIQLCRRPHLPGAAAANLREWLFMVLLRLFCDMPGVAKLPAATVVELVELVLQTLVDKPRAMGFISLAACHLLHNLQLRPTMSSRRLAPAHVKRLLALLLGPTAAAATEAYKSQLMFADTPIMVWLARQPGAVAAAAELGLTAADVPDPDAAALLFGGQGTEADA
jgi:hypothetical protein